jgi:hypothetical protein
MNEGNYTSLKPGVRLRTLRLSSDVLEFRILD